VEVYINYLRRKLGTTMSQGLGTMRVRSPSVIRTVRGEGYVLGGPGGIEENAERTARRSEASLSSERPGMFAKEWIADA